MERHQAIAIGATALAVSLLGGGSAGAAASPSDQIVRVVRSYDQAFAAGRYRKACALMTPTARRAVASIGPGGCRRQLRRWSGFTAGEARALGRAGISAADIRGDKADVIVTPPGYPTNGARLHRLKGRWLVSIPPSVIQSA